MNTKKNRNRPNTHKNPPKALTKELLFFLNKRPSASYTSAQIAEALRLSGSKQVQDLEELLTVLEGNKAIKRVKGKQFKALAEAEERIGVVDFVNAKYAFIVCEDFENDVRVQEHKLKKALDGDLVRVHLNSRGRSSKPEGSVVEILEKRTRDFVGTISINSKFAFVDCNGRRMHYDIFVPKSGINGANNGDKVIVTLESWAEKDKNPVGKVSRVLGQAGDNDAEIHSIMFEFDLPFHFPEGLEEAAAKLPEDISEKEIAKRRDFRPITTFTIDPLTAKDFDDALSIQKLDNGHWEIGIHIADVTHYVKENTTLEEEAIKRATSVYLVDRTVPMLPEKLSNELCSLRPHEDKLTFSAVFELNDKAEVQKEWFGRTIIYSDRRFTYEEAQERLESSEGDFAEELLTLNQLAKKLQKQRFDQGAISFESVEFVFELADDGKPIGLFPKIRQDAHKLVEEFMLLANKQVATFVYNKKKGDKSPAMVYRIHDDPDPERLQNLAMFARRFGHSLNFEKEGVANSINKLTEKVAGKPEQNLIESQAIRSMAKAKYTTEEKGHYGLAFKHYTHFTSPIRRYPDMMVHRLLQRYLDNQNSADKAEYEEKCKHSSAMEKRAADAERASIKYKQVEFMQNYLGKEMKGIISGLTEWGIYVEVDETRCEGMLRLSSLSDDHYYFDEDTMQVVGKRHKHIYNMGDVVNVVVASTNLDKRTIDLELV